ncbi:MAG: hypothetical protein MUF51_09300 [Vicinamibacteria bacterium]|nr:hypothetical protein [Vicinamibacteria bacterium]
MEMKRIVTRVVSLSFEACSLAWVLCATSSWTWGAQPDVSAAKSAVKLLPLVIARETTYITEPLTPEGLPDYAAWLNRKYGAGVTRENNAAAHLIAFLPGSQMPETLTALGLDAKAPPSVPSWIGSPIRRPDSTPDLRRILEARMASAASRPVGLERIPEDLSRAFFGEWQRAQSRPWTERDCPLIAVWLEANAEALEVIVKATARSRYFVPLPYGLAVRQTNWLQFREIATALRIRALYFAGRGDTDRAQGDLVAGLRLGRLLGQDARVLPRLIGVATAGIALEVAPVLLSAAEPRAATLRRLRDELQRLPDARPTDEAIREAERFVGLQFVLDMRAAAGEGRMEAWLRNTASRDGFRYPEAISRVPPGLIDWNEMLRIKNRVVDGADTLREYKDDVAWTAAVEHLIAQAKTDRAAQRELVRVLLAVPAYSEAMGGWMPFALGSSGSQRANVSWNEVEAERRLVTAATAAALHRAEKGAFPTTLAELQAHSPEATVDLTNERGDYVIRFHGSPDGAHYAIAATPKTSGETGVRRFCVDDGARMILSSFEAGAFQFTSPQCPDKK